jgi:hypothetical protein
MAITGNMPEVRTLGFSTTDIERYSSVLHLLKQGKTNVSAVSVHYNL